MSFNSANGPGMSLPEPPENFREEGGRLVSGPNLPPKRKEPSRLSRRMARSAPVLFIITIGLVVAFVFHSGGFSSPSPDEQAAKLLTPEWTALVVQPYTSSADPGVQKVIADLKAWSEETGCKLVGGSTTFGDDLELVKDDTEALLTPAEGEGYASRVITNPVPEAFKGRYVGAAITVDCTKETQAPRGPFGG